MPFLTYALDGDPGLPETVTASSDAVQSFTKTTYEPTSGIYKGMQARMMLIQVIGNSVNMTKDGTNPTATAGTNLGITLVAGSSQVVTGINAIRNMKWLNAVAGSNATVKGEPYF